MDDDEYSEVICKAFYDTSCTVEYVIGLFSNFFDDRIIVRLFYAKKCGLPDGRVQLVERGSFGLHNYSVVRRYFTKLFSDLSLRHFDVPFLAFASRHTVCSSLSSDWQRLFLTFASMLLVIPFPIDNDLCQLTICLFCVHTYLI